MASDLISRKALLQLLYEKWLNNTPNRTCFFLDGKIQRTAEAETIEKIMKEIEGMPTVDAVEVVHGEWISLTDCSNAGVYCSVCKKKVWKEDYAWCNRKNKLRSNYCPNCGADMRGVDNE